MITFRFLTILIACAWIGCRPESTSDEKDILKMYQRKFNLFSHSFSSVSSRRKLRNQFSSSSLSTRSFVFYPADQQESSFPNPTPEQVEQYFEENPNKRRILDDYYDCTGYTRPEILAKFMGIPTSTAQTNDTTYAVTLTADEERTGLVFWQSTTEMEAWKLVEYNGANISITDCGYSTDCRDTVLTNYFRFANKADTDTFPRVEQITAVTNTSITILISSTTENAGPLVLGLLYNNINSTDDCYWTPYQVVAWISASAPTITGIVQGGLDDTDTSDWATSYLIAKDSRTSGSGM